MTKDILRLPAYPSTTSRNELSASQLATLNQTVASTLSIVLALPSEKRHTPSTRTFLATYGRDTAFQSLQNIIWRASSSQGYANSNDDRSQWPRSTDEKLIHKRSLLLAEKLAQSASEPDLQILLDLAVIYARTQPSHLHRVFVAASASQSTPSLPEAIATELVPTFTALLSQETPTAHGLYAQRKIAECVFAFLRGAKGSPELIHPFARSKEFIVALAWLYDVGMSAIAISYGGITALTAGISAQDRAADEWETIWVETKVALLDAFHIILSVVLDDLAACPPGPWLADEVERAFDTGFALLEGPSSPSRGTPVPFLNQPLIADYQHSYSFTELLARAIKHAQEKKDVRLDLLESTLQSFEASAENDATNSKPAGALKILLRSSGIQPGIDNLGTRNARSQPTTTTTTSSSTRHPAPTTQPLVNVKAKGKSRAAPTVDLNDDTELDIKATQVLDILPDTPVRYVKFLLAHDRYGRDPERVIEALLEGTAMGEDELELHDLQRADGADGDGADGAAFDDGLAAEVQHLEQARPQQQQYSVNQRRNVFDQDELDLSRLRFGKKAAGDEVLRDRSFIEEMKADILRRAEAISDEEEEDDGGLEGAFAAKKPTKGKGRATVLRAVDIGPDEDEDDLVALRVAGDGEDSGDDDDGDEDEESEVEEEHQTPETIVERAYLDDPKVFERDAATKRSKARADLKAQTGWTDEQIEGWKVMLERNPAQKEKLTEKYAFRGNEKGLEVRPGGGGGARGRGRGRGAPRGGRGRGGHGRGGASGGAAGGGGGEGSARERAWKDKNKASRGNHNRKRGHDKKMARAGAVAGPST